MKTYPTETFSLSGTTTPESKFLDFKNCTLTWPFVLPFLVKLYLYIYNKYEYTWMKILQNWLYCFLHSLLFSFLDSYYQTSCRNSTFAQRPPFGQKSSYSGSITSGSVVFVPCLKENFLSTLMIATLVSRRANRIPMQARGP